MNGIARDRKIVGEENRPERPLLAPMPPTLPAATNTASGLACAMKRSTASEWRKSSSFAPVCSDYFAPVRARSAARWRRPPCRHGRRHKRAYRAIRIGAFIG